MTTTEIASRGIRTLGYLDSFSAALISDILNGSVSLKTSNAAQRLVGRMIKNVEDGGQEGDAKWESLAENIRRLLAGELSPKEANQIKD